MPGNVCTKWQRDKNVETGELRHSTITKEYVLIAQQLLFPGVGVKLEESLNPSEKRDKIAAA